MAKRRFEFVISPGLYRACSTAARATDETRGLSAWLSEVLKAGLPPVIYAGTAVAPEGWPAVRRAEAKRVVAALDAGTGAGLVAVSGWLSVDQADVARYYAEAAAFAIADAAEGRLMSQLRAAEAAGRALAGC